LNEKEEKDRAEKEVEQQRKRNVVKFSLAYEQILMQVMLNKWRAETT